MAPPGYCSEWWALEVKKALQNFAGGDKDQRYLPNNSRKDNLPLEKIERLLLNHFTEIPSWEEAKLLSENFLVPLHPAHTFYWKLITVPQLEQLVSWLRQGKLKKDESGARKIILPLFESEPIHLSGKKVLEEAGVPHQVVNKESVILWKNVAEPFAFSFGFNTQEDLEKLTLPKSALESSDGLCALNKISPVLIADKAGTFIGARMGRPEKAKMRALTGSPQVMFPVGEEGDRLRSFHSASQAGKVKSTFPLFYCGACKKETIYPSCETCSASTSRRFSCKTCGILESETCRHGQTKPYLNKEIDIKYYLTQALSHLGEPVLPEQVKGIRGTSNKEHLVEHLAKGILRAKHNLCVNKDGTTRYDGTELPITHFKPKEVKTSLEKLRDLGYLLDKEGLPLTSVDQILELKPQDLILPGFNSLEESAPRVLLRVAKFVDDLFVKFYKLPPFYQLKKEEDLVGHLVFGLAPHISAGLIGRIIGFSETQGLLAHPMYHAGLRRDCDGDEACVMLLMDALLNFSRQYLPEKRGAKTMDSPLVLTSILYPTEVDDQVHGVDVEWGYPLEFYEAALQMKNPWEVKSGPTQKKIAQLGDRLGTSLQYESFGYTHPVENINGGVQCSAYKTLPSMNEKLIGQMEIARQVRAVHADDVARLVIQKHFLRDIQGNLRKFSTQQFRCVKCSEKYRRPPLQGNCTACGGRLLFTVTEGSVLKYLEPSLLLADNYSFSPYLKQHLQILKKNTDMVFGKEKEKQVGLKNFV